jgi:acyl-CoA thioesterase-2
MPDPTLLETLALERLELDLFRGGTPGGPWKAEGHLYGGQVVAQSLLAAYQTLEERLCHSLHCYFIRAGDPTVPVIFEVDRSRDGGTFATRRVVAIQHGKQIFNMAASFQKPEEGFEHQAPIPPVPNWREIRSEAEFLEGLDALQQQEWRSVRRPIEMRDPDPTQMFSGEPRLPREPHQDVWMRARDPIPDDQRLQQVVLAYASDLTMIPTAARVHPMDFGGPGAQIASLDHAIWFHRPVKFNDWHLFAQQSPSASGGRGFTLASAYSEDGRLVATFAQEGLMRARVPKPPTS